MEYFGGDYYGFSSVNNVTANNCINGVHFAVDDLLDFSKEDETVTDGFFYCLAGNSGDSSTVTAVESCNSLVSGGGNGQFNGNVSCRSFNESQFSGDELCVPYDDLAELEWLSNFVEESFLTDDLHHFSPTTTSAAVNNDATDSSSSANTTHSSPIFPSNISIPGKARSKRSRAPPCDWSSRLLLLSPSSNSKTTPSKKREPTETPGGKCLHCASEKTPQWRTGPMGPKTLCNACGVRHQSGRLVPEYRPAASPTFVPIKHSNSHRKVLELRRHKELQQQQMINQASIFNASTVAMIS